eukprot:355683_1
MLYIAAGTSATRNESSAFHLDISDFNSLLMDKPKTQNINLMHSCTITTDDLMLRGGRYHSLRKGWIPNWMDTSNIAKKPRWVIGAVFAPFNVLKWLPMVD